MPPLKTVVIGGGQSGLSVGYHLAQRGMDFVILDKHQRVGDSWRTRWDSLRLFTPARYDGLVGMPFPAPRHYFPTKDEMGDYLESYAKEFKLPVRTGITVEKVSRENGMFVVSTNAGQLEAENVVIAMANYQEPRIPNFARDLSPDIVQIHSREYRRPSQLGPGDVLVVGAGNSGAEIALEAARNGHRTFMAGRNVGHIPFRIGGLLARIALAPLTLRFVFHRVLTVNTPIGRRARQKILFKGGPLIRVMESDLDEAGVERVPRARAARLGKVLLDNGRVMDVANIVWCTGFDHAVRWIDMPIFDAHGEPKQKSGIAEDVPGLYFVGRHFQHALSSTMIHGVARDAKRVASVIERRERSRAAGAA